MSDMSRLGEPLIDLRGVTAGYGDSQVLFGVDLRIDSGQVVTLLGRNGMGKTTTLRTLFGLLPLRGGEIRLRGQTVQRVAPQKMAAAGLALVPEGRRIFPNLTVDENLRVFAGAGATGQARWTPDSLYQLFPRLAERRRNLGNQLSGGEQQMLAIGRALSTNPSLLVLDEATEGLAPLIREEIWTCLRRIKAEGQTILIIDKYIGKLLAFADHHTILEKGRVVWHGDNQALGAEAALLTRYLSID